MEAPADSERVDDDPVPDQEPDADAALARDLRDCSASGDTGGMAADAEPGPGAVGAAAVGGEGLSVGMGVSVTGSECVVAVAVVAVVAVVPVVLVAVVTVVAVVGAVVRCFLNGCICLDDDGCHARALEVYYGLTVVLRWTMMTVLTGTSTLVSV